MLKWNIFFPMTDYCLSLSVRLMPLNLVYHTIINKTIGAYENINKLYDI